jgi:hypothetical protein
VLFFEKFLLTSGQDLLRLSYIIDILVLVKTIAEENGLVPENVSEKDKN